jgi:hypothetical protein
LSGNHPATSKGTQPSVPAGSPAADSALHVYAAETSDPVPDSNARIDAENRRLDRSIDSICRGC